MATLLQLQSCMTTCQRTIVTRALEWEQASGATFEAKKTAFIHFSRNATKVSNLPLHVKDRDILPSEAMKVLGVILDQHLRYREHMTRATEKGVSAALALGRLRGLQLRAARQLFVATVATRMDYASPVWFLHTPKQRWSALDQAQRIGAQAIVGAFHTVALPVAESEAAIDPVAIRLENQLVRYWVDLHTQPTNHPFWIIHRRLHRSQSRF